MGLAGAQTEGVPLLRVATHRSREEEWGQGCRHGVNYGGS